MNRPRIGADCIGVGVGAIIVRGDGKVLLAKRGAHAKNERGKWEFPGGEVRFGETQRDAIRREIREEFGVEVDVGELVGVADHILPEEKQHWVSPAYICSIIRGEPRILEPEKCEAVSWTLAEDLLKYDLTVASAQTLAMLKKGFLRDTFLDRGGDKS